MNKRHIDFQSKVKQMCVSIFDTQEQDRRKAAQQQKRKIKKLLKGRSLTLLTSEETQEFVRLIFAE